MQFNGVALPGAFCPYYIMSFASKVQTFVSAVRSHWGLLRAKVCYNTEHEGFSFFVGIYVDVRTSVC